MKRYHILTAIAFFFCLISTPISSDASYIDLNVLLEEAIVTLLNSDDPARDCLDAAWNSLQLAAGINWAMTILDSLGCLFQADAICLASEAMGIVGQLVLAHDTFSTQVENCYSMHGPVCGPPWSPPA